MHEQDLAIWVKSKPHSALAKLSKRGVTYSKCFIRGVTDSFPGTMALVTGEGRVLCLSRA